MKSNLIKNRLRELTIYFHPFHLHKQSCQKPYHHSRALTSEQSGWNSQFETYLLIPMDSYRKTPAIQSSGHPPRNRRHQTINKQKHELRTPLGNYTWGKFHTNLGA